MAKGAGLERHNRFKCARLHKDRTTFLLQEHRSLLWKLLVLRHYLTGNSKYTEKYKCFNEQIEIIDRELDFMDSYTRTLDSILTLQDLASIHKVESSINYLTIVLVIGTAISIILELLVVLELI